MVFDNFDDGCSDGGGGGGDIFNSDNIGDNYFKKFNQFFLKK